MRTHPVIMDGETTFDSMYDAARHVCAEGGLPPKTSAVRTISSNIKKTMGKSKRDGTPKTAYGHVWEDAEPTLVERVSELEALIRDMVPYMGDGIGADGVMRRVKAALEGDR